MTGLAFIEVAPGIAYQFELLGGKVRVGAAYRYTLTTFQRKITDLKEGEKEEKKYHDIDMEGANTLGYRVGLQGTFGDLDIGIVYRSGFNVNMNEVDRGDTKTFVQQTPAENVGFEFTLPRKLGMGARLRMTDSIRVAADLEYLFNSDNKTSSFTGKECAFGECKQELTLTNYAMWDDGMTLRLGGEYQVNKSVFARLGYIYDTKSANIKYPSAFGTPPAPTMSYTVGGEYRVGNGLSIAVALAYRSGSVDITEDQLGTDDKGNLQCQFCGKEGTYRIAMLGGCLDAVIRF